MICTYVYLQHKKLLVCRTGTNCQDKKSTGIIANMVANIITELLMYQLPTRWVIQ